MKVLFDNNTSPRLARCLHGFIAADGHTAVHLRDRFVADVKDVDWIGALAMEADEWIVISGDRAITKNKAEREAWRKSGLRGFFLAPGWQKLPLHQQAGRLLWRWPELLQQAQLIAPGAIFQVPIGFSARFKQIPY